MKIHRYLAKNKKTLADTSDDLKMPGPFEERKVDNYDSERVGKANPNLFTEDNLKKAISEVDELSSLIDIVEGSPQKTEVSPDHFAFEFFDSAPNVYRFEDAEFQDENSKFNSETHTIYR